MRNLLAARHGPGDRRSRRDRDPGHHHQVNGTTQATYDGHPLYTYVGDTAPGQDKGNGLNLSGGVWHDVTVSGSAAPAASAASASSSSHGGYGY